MFAAWWLQNKAVRLLDPASMWKPILRWAPARVRWALVTWRVPGRNALRNHAADFQVSFVLSFPCFSSWVWLRKQPKDHSSLHGAKVYQRWHDLFGVLSLLVFIANQKSSVVMQLKGWIASRIWNWAWRLYTCGCKKYKSLLLWERGSSA